MNVRLKLVFYLFVIFTIKGHSQSNSLTDSIEYYAQELIRNQDLGTREYSFDYLNTNFQQYLQNFADFRDSFPRFEGLAVLEDKELNLRIITYQLYKDTSSYRYGGWVQSPMLKTPVFLNDASTVWEDDQDLDYLTLDPGDWYGALYYQMKLFSRSRDELVVLLFGLDNYHFFTKRKVMEPLVIGKGFIKFGKPLIEMEAGLPDEFRKKRYILDYSVQAPASFRYDVDRDKIIFDHLTFMSSDIPQQKIMRVPDGTYSGFEIDEKEHKLVFIEKVFDQVLDKAPGGREKPEVKRDLFGGPER